MEDKSEREDKKVDSEEKSEVNEGENEADKDEESENQQEDGESETPKRERKPDESERRVSWASSFYEKSNGKEGKRKQDDEKDPESKDEDDELESQQEDGESETSESEKKKPAERKRRGSIVQFFSGKSDDSDENPKKAKSSRRPSFFRNFVALEKELNFENIHEKVTSIFSPVQEKSESMDEGCHEHDKKPKRVHISSAMAAMFIVSATTGSALTGMSYHLMQSSWFGVFLILLLGINALYSALCIGWCWNIMEQKWPEYLEYTRTPYQAIAYRAVGSWMKYIVAICKDITILGACASYILFIAHALEETISGQLDFCYLIIIISLILIPFTFFGSYRDIKFVGVLDLLLSLLYTLLLIVGFFFDKSSRGPSTYSDASATSVLLAFAGMSYAYGVGAILPSIIADMTDRRMFTHTCVTSFMIILALYSVLPIIGYAAYGDGTPRNIGNNILRNEKLFSFGVVIDVLYILQLSTTFIIFLIPTSHAFEERLNCPDEFGVFRACIRLMIVVLIMLVILGVPYLSKFVDVVGATTMILLTFVFPPLFYVCLVYKKKTKSSERKLSKKEWVLVIEIILLGIVVGATATYVSILEYINSPPNRLSCYLNMTSSKASHKQLFR